jgi:hypothetical protein
MQTRETYSNKYDTWTVVHINVGTVAGNFYESTPGRAPGDNSVSVDCIPLNGELNFFDLVFFLQCRCLYSSAWRGTTVNLTDSQPAVPRQALPHKLQHYDATQPTQSNSSLDGIQSKLSLISQRRSPTSLFAKITPATIFTLLTVAHLLYLLLSFICMYRVFARRASSPHLKFRGLMMANYNRRNM